MITPGGMTDKNVSTESNQSNQSTSSILLIVNDSGKRHELNDKSDTIDKIAFIFIPSSIYPTQTGKSHLVGIFYASTVQYNNKTTFN